MGGLEKQGCAEGFDARLIQQFPTFAHTYYALARQHCHARHRRPDKTRSGGTDNVPTTCTTMSMFDVMQRASVSPQEIPHPLRHPNRTTPGFRNEATPLREAAWTLSVHRVVREESSRSPRAMWSDGGPQAERGSDCLEWSGVVAKDSQCNCLASGRGEVLRVTAVSGSLRLQECGARSAAALERGGCELQLRQDAGR